MRREQLPVKRVHIKANGSGSSLFLSIQALVPVRALEGFLASTGLDVEPFMRPTIRGR